MEPSKSSSKIPDLPSSLDIQALFHGIRWFQRWEIFRNVFTPGIRPIFDLCESIGLPKDLTGKRVLDIGAENGCLSFECERRNALEVVALDPGYPALKGFNHLKRALGSKRTRHIRGTVYHLDPRELGFFDVVLFCGVLYHLRHPLLALDNIRRVARGEIYVETAVNCTAPMKFGVWVMSAIEPIGVFYTELFSFLRERWEDLFQVGFEVLLYDLTSAYFECTPPDTGKRKFGYSRDKRFDCVQVVIALVVTPEGIPLAYEVMPGNTRDKKTLRDFLKRLKTNTGR